MLQNQNTSSANRLTGLALVLLIMINAQAAAFDNPPQRCDGFGNLQSISKTDWETDFDLWTVGTAVTSPDDFDTPDWAVVGNLPDNRSGKAAFVANLELSSFCENLVQMGSLWLDSPPIDIPVDAVVPRISIGHWFLTEKDLDGGNFKISVNDGDFNLIPVEAIEFGPYVSTLHPPLTGDDKPWNLNPLAGQDAFTGPNEAEPFSPSGWGQSHINLNLVGIAVAGKTVKLRFDFGIDECDGGEILNGDDYDWGWYVAEVEFYSCSAEVLPSDTSLTLVKQVINNNGGTAESADWTLSATGGPTPFSGPGPSVSSNTNFESGSYDLLESGGPEGYIASTWNCDGGSLDGATITVSLGQAVTCTITNDDLDFFEVLFKDGFE